MIDRKILNIERRFNMQRVARSPLVLTLIIVAFTISYWGCAKMIGDKNENLSPNVNFVNTPKDASLGDSTSSWVLNMPFTLFGFDPQDSSIFSLFDEPYQLVQFPEVVVWDETLRVAVVPDSPVVIKFYDGVDTTYYQEDIDYAIEEPLTLLFRALESGSMQERKVEETEYLELADSIYIDPSGDSTFFSIDTLIYFADFKLNTPNFYVFNYAPIIYWYGTDPDGFVESYSYADIDEDFAPEAIADPESYKSQIPPYKWVNTPSTFTIIYLLSAAGDTTEHVVYLRCYDNDGASSNIVYRTFFRSNQAPNTPLIKWDEQSDSEYDTLNYITTDTLGYVMDDTLYSLNSVSPTWPGIILRWKGDDPDDKELYTIPLTYQYYLMMQEEDGEFSDTVWEWSQEELTDDQEVTIVGLETGSYKFTVWSYDDGFEQSPSPGVLYFHCIKPALRNPAYARSILLYDETVAGGMFCELPNNTVIDSFYLDILERLEPEMNPEYGYDYENPFDLNGNLGEGEDVVYWDNSAASLGNIVPVSFISQFKLVIFYADDHKAVPASGNNVKWRDFVFHRYINVGGRLWIMGRRLFNGSFGEGPGVATTNNLLLNDMQVMQKYTTQWPSTTNQPFEFTAASNAVDFLDTLYVNEAYLDTVGNQAYMDSLNIIFGLPSIIGGLPEIDWVARNEDATTLYYFYSVTGAIAELDKEVTQDSLVMDWTDTPPKDAPDGSECWITLPDDNINEVYSVVNHSKLNSVGEIISLSSADEIMVSYNFIPVQIEDENSEVLDSSTPGGNYSDPTTTVCFIRTQYYDQVFSKIFNITRNSYAQPVSYSQFEVQVNYPDTVVEITPTHFDYEEPDVLTANDTSCTVELNKHYIDDLQMIYNFSKNWDGYLISKVDNILTIGYSPQAGLQWEDSDSIVVEFTYHQYWEVGDSLEVDYMSDIYWEKTDTLTVAYNYTPVTEAHLKPCAIRYEYYDFYNYSFYRLYFRTAVFTFPLYFIDNDIQPGETMGRVDQLFLNMLDWFLDPNIHLGE